jgi:hypothetical protein
MRVLIALDYFAKFSLTLLIRASTLPIFSMPSAPVQKLYSILALNRCTCHRKNWQSAHTDKQIKLVMKTCSSVIGLITPLL